jgi:hypothetical protein
MRADYTISLSLQILLGCCGTRVRFSRAATERVEARIKRAQRVSGSIAKKILQSCSYLGWFLFHQPVAGRESYRFDVVRY